MNEKMLDAVGTSAFGETDNGYRFGSFFEHWFSAG